MGWRLFQKRLENKNKTHDAVAIRNKKHGRDKAG